MATHKCGMVLVTPRLSLRPLTMIDAEPLAALANDWQIARMTAFIPHPYTLDAARAFIASRGDASELTFGVRDRTGFVGCCGVETGEVAGAEIGYWVGAPYRGRGYATEMTRALIRLAFANGCNRVTIGHFADNPASARVIAACGFVPTGMAERWCRARAALVTCPTYDMNRERAAALGYLQAGPT